MATCVRTLRSRDFSEEPDRLISSKAGGGVDDEDEVEGKLRKSPASSFARGRNETKLLFPKIKIIKKIIK